MDISIFAKRAFLNTNPYNEFISKEKSYKGHGHLQRVSSMIREQVVPFIGAKLNPTSGYENDICIYVKPHIKKDNMDFKFEGKKAYLDIIDGHNLGQLLLKYPEVGLIVCSQVDYETMSKLIPNKIVLIPQHHCNFEQLERNSTEIKRIGVIGTRDAFPHLPKELKSELAKRGIELIEFSKFFSRQDIIDFYMNIDLQIVWRPYKKLLSNPLKIVNAASFGIPTIALNEPAFVEVDDCYIGVRNEKQLFDVLDNLRGINLLYSTLSKQCLKKAEDYHIENITKLYQQL